MDIETNENDNLLSNQIDDVKTEISRPKPRAIHFMKNFKNALPEDKATLRAGIFFRCGNGVTALEFMFKIHKLLPMKVLLMAFVQPCAFLVARILPQLMQLRRSDKLVVS